jgi:hypothetical protein
MSRRPQLDPRPTTCSPPQLPLQTLTQIPRLCHTTSDNESSARGHCGNLQITVAPTLRDLETRAPWSRFPSAAGRVDAILAGVRAAYPDGYGFVIAEALPGVQVSESGFSVVFRSVRPFVPTAHESTAAVDSLIAMDVDVVAVNCVLEPASVCTEGQLATPYTGGPGSSDSFPRVCDNASRVLYRVDDSGLRTLPQRWGARTLLSAIPVRGAGALHSGTLLEHAEPRVVAKMRMRGPHFNKNVTGHVVTDAEVQALHDTFAQLDGWLTLRSQVGEAPFVHGGITVPERSAPSVGGGFQAGGRRSSQRSDRRGQGGFTGRGGGGGGDFNHHQHQLYVIAPSNRAAIATDTHDWL